MTLTLGAGLVGLSLVDSTSFGTLLIPIWLLLTPGRVHGARVAVYLGTVVAFYFAVGIALALGADAAVMALREPVAYVPTTFLRGAQLVLGVALIVLSYVLEARIRSRKGQGEGTIQRWRSRALTDAGGGGAASLVKLALIGTSIELLTMLPYLVAIGLLTTADLGPAMLGLSLAGYCLLMVLPAAVLSIARIVFYSRINPVLVRINDWFTRHSDKAVGWTVGGIGIGLAINAAVNLGVGG